MSLFETTIILIVCLLIIATYKTITYIKYRIKIRFFVNDINDCLTRVTRRNCSIPELKDKDRK